MVVVRWSFYVSGSATVEGGRLAVKGPVSGSVARADGPGIKWVQRWKVPRDLAMNRKAANLEVHATGAWSGFFAYSAFWRLDED
jgi:hypothetical protein